LEKLAKAIPIVLAIYLVIKFSQLATSGDLKYLFTSGLMSYLFWTEILVGAALPLLLFSFKEVRQSPKGLFMGVIAVLLGMILNRFNVSWFAVTHPDPITYMPTFMGQVTYFPSLPEVAISVGIFSAGILAFGLAAKYLQVFEEEDHHDTKA
jgi:Ni/Fe-hydrogenase subunit HybB-like protein